MKPLTRVRILFGLTDLMIVTFCSLLAAYLHRGIRVRLNDPAYVHGFFVLAVTWIVVSQLTRKFRIGERKRLSEVFYSILFSNFAILAVCSIFMVFFHYIFVSRFIFFGTVALITGVELLLGALYVSVQRSVFLRDWMGMEIADAQLSQYRDRRRRGPVLLPGNYEAMKQSITEEAGEEAFAWLDRQLDITDPDQPVLSTQSRFNLISLPDGLCEGIVNLQRINSISRINKFFETVNAKLVPDGLFICCVETYVLRRRRILARYWFGINYLFLWFDTFLHRVLPKLSSTQKLYFLITRGKNRALSRAESIGRLYSCGFELLEEKTTGNLLYLKAVRVREPYYDTDPSYGIFIRLRRIGLGGKEFNVFKLRTMHAYSEYIQRYVYEQHRLDEGGKIKDDFRVTSLGRFLRRYWIDELPMVLNIIRGEMKLVGVRPLSPHYLSLYTDVMRREHVSVKPGLVPPYYADFPTPSTLEEVQANELAYITAWRAHPFLTDVRYLFRAIYNILFRKARSK